jgi:hypothetical protein
MKIYDMKLKNVENLLLEYEQVVTVKKSLVLELIEIQVELNAYYKKYHVEREATPKHIIKEKQSEVDIIQKRIESLNDEIDFYKKAIMFHSIKRDLKSIEQVKLD